MDKWKAFIEEDRAYFRDRRSAIAAQNTRMLKDGCIVYALVLAFYTALSLLTRQPIVLEHMYYLFDGIHLLLCAVVYVCVSRRRASAGTIQILCVLLELSLLGFFALEGALVSQTQHSLYVPIAILLIQIFFVHRRWYAFLIIFLYTFSFALISCLYKTPEAYINDVYIAVATLISAGIANILISRLRFNEGRATSQLENMSRIDSLTGLYNKAEADRLCRGVIGEKERPCTLVMIDLDNFKHINDTFGHVVGDEVLAGMGDAMRGSFRAQDVKGRFGGDEFIVLMDNCENIEVVRERMNELRARAATLRFSAQETALQYCAGITVKREGDDFDTMFARADRALYAAKGAGKNCFKIE